MKVSAGTGTSTSAPTTAGYAYFLQTITSMLGPRWYRYINYNNSTTPQIGAWQAVLDTDNYDNYALPLSGGTLTGSVLWSSGYPQIKRTTAGYGYTLDDKTNSTTYVMTQLGVLGTTDAIGIGRICLGNSTPTGTAGNARGQITLYSPSQYATNIYSTTMAATRNYFFQDHGATGYSVVVPETATAVGSSTGPVYVNNKGVVAACGSSLAVSITGNAATATKANQLTTARSINSVSFDGTKNITFAGTYKSNTAYNTLPTGISYIEFPSSATVAGDITYGTCLTVYMSTSRAWQMVVNNNATEINVRALHSNHTTSAAGTGYSAWRALANIADGTAVGNTGKPVYVTATGEVKACTSVPSCSWNASTSTLTITV